MVKILQKEAEQAEQGVESLDAIAAEALQLDAAPQQAQALQQQAQAQANTHNNAAELLQAAQIVRAMALPILPEHQREPLARVWSDAVIKQASDAGAAVMDLHGLSMGDVMGKYAPYIALAAALAPPTLATVRIVKAPPPQPAKDATLADGQQQ